MMFDLRDIIFNPHAKVIDVDTGEVRVLCVSGILRAQALGSCIAVIASAPGKKTGGIAHVMLPGRCPIKESENRNKYAEDAIDNLMKELSAHGIKGPSLKIFLIGGADVIGEGDIHRLVKDSVLGYLRSLDIKPAAQCLGGTNARSAWLDIGDDCVYFKESDNNVKKLLVGENV